MEYEKLRAYIISGMNPDRAHGEAKNYQSVVIRFLNQTSNGVAEKSEIITELQKKNPHNDSINTSTLNIISGVLKTHKVISDEDNLITLLDFKSYTSGEKAEITKQCEKRINQDNQVHEYFLLRHNVDSPWDDVEGNKYHFGKTVPNQKKLRNAGIGTKTIWFTKNGSEYYFWGYGTVKEIEVLQEGERWNLTYDDYTFFEKQDDSIELDGKFLKHGNESIKEQIEHVENFNNQHAMFPITKKIYEEITSGRTMNSTENKLDVKVDYSRIINILEHKKNIILYGPPGTGKTYQAYKIIEEFTKDNAGKTAICYPSDKGIEKIKLFGEFIDKNGKLLWGVGWDLPRIQESSYPVRGYVYFQGNIIAVANIVRISAHDNTSKDDLELRPTGLGYPEDYKHYLHMDNLEICESFPHKKLVLQDRTKEMPDVIQQRVYVDEINPFQKLVTFHQSYGYEEFMEGIKPKSTNNGITYKIEDGVFKQFCNLASKDIPENKYVIVIDEINRGNISKIFGELITILEKDKRGKPITLSYSKENFSVPKNVYVIGTMNTADQSLTHMDAALKRRFSLVEVMPNPNLLKNTTSGIPLSLILKIINDRIITHSSRDNQIGHSYFMNDGNTVDSIEELQFSFATDIIPLLRDYFYDDEDSLKEILGGQFIDWDNPHRNIEEGWQKSPSVFLQTLRDAFGVEIASN